jgi:dTDP-4-dehydrorhamnose reductase
MIAIIGATGLIGSAVESELRSRGVHVVGTSRSPESDAQSRLEFADRDTWSALPADVSAVLVCAGVSDVRECREHPASTSAVNVVAATDFARFAADRGAVPVVLSTSYVFDGSRPDFSPDDEVCPMSEYGRQKAEMEREVTASVPGASIVRLTKVFGGTNRLLSGWRHELLEGRTVAAASDARVSPLTADFVANAFADMLLNPRAGVWHLSAIDDVTWFEIAEKLAARYGSGRGAVLARCFTEIDPTAEFVPRFGSLKPVWPNRLADQRSVLAVDRELENICASL